MDGKLYIEYWREGVVSLSLCRRILHIPLAFPTVVSLVRYALCHCNVSGLQKGCGEQEPHELLSEEKPGGDKRHKEALLSFLMRLCSGNDKDSLDKSSLNAGAHAV